MKLIEEIDLPNELKLRIFDLSRSIAKNTVKVEILFQTKIGLTPSYFADAGDYNRVRNIFGDELTYEHRLTRSYVPAKDEDKTRVELVETFKKNSLSYLSSSDFARKLAHAMLRDIIKNPYKYSTNLKAKHD